MQNEKTPCVWLALTLALLGLGCAPESGLSDLESSAAKGSQHQDGRPGFEGGCETSFQCDGEQLCSEDHRCVESALACPDSGGAATEPAVQGDAVPAMRCEPEGPEDRQQYLLALKTRALDMLSAQLKVYTGELEQVSTFLQEDVGATFEDALETPSDSNLFVQLLASRLSDQYAAWHAYESAWEDAAEQVVAARHAQLTIHQNAVNRFARPEARKESALEAFRSVPSFQVVEGVPEPAASGTYNVSAAQVELALNEPKMCEYRRVWQVERAALHSQEMARQLMETFRHPFFEQDSSDALIATLDDVGTDAGLRAFARALAVVIPEVTGRIGDAVSQVSDLDVGDIALLASRPRLAGAVREEVGGRFDAVHCTILGETNWWQVGASVSLGLGALLNWVPFPVVKLVGVGLLAVGTALSLKDAWDAWEESALVGSLTPLGLARYEADWSAWMAVCGRALVAAVGAGFTTVQLMQVLRAMGTAAVGERQIMALFRDAFARGEIDPHTYAMAVRANPGAAMQILGSSTLRVYLNPEPIPRLARLIASLSDDAVALETREFMRGQLNLAATDSVGVAPMFEELSKRVVSTVGDYHAGFLRPGVYLSPGNYTIAVMKNGQFRYLMEHPQTTEVVKSALRLTGRVEQRHSLMALLGRERVDDLWRIWHISVDEQRVQTFAGYTWRSSVGLPDLTALSHSGHALGGRAHVVAQ